MKEKTMGRVVSSVQLLFFFMFKDESGSTRARKTSCVNKTTNQFSLFNFLIFTTTDYTQIYFGCRYSA